MSIFLGANGAIDPVWAVSFEDDLVMTNVRSFDVKAYDSVLGNYADLGWGDDVRFAASVMTPAAAGGFCTEIRTTPRARMCRRSWASWAGCGLHQYHVRARGADAADHERPAV